MGSLILHSSIQSHTCGCTLSTTATMIWRFVLSLRNYIKNYFFPHGQSEDCKNLHFKKICSAGQDIQNTDLLLEQRILAVHHIGILAYTGGYEGATCASEYMPVMAAFLKEPSLSDYQRIMALEGLSGICYLNLTNQNVAKFLGVVTTLQELLDPACPLAPSTKAQMWSCYLMKILCCNNIPLIRTMVSSEVLRQNLEGLAGKDWCGWPKNFARELLCILGYQTFTTS
ncbi:hypothetical protein UPYG_G00334650 [Umbra pygmaea]|uniref:Uncharacterized protein n=1 Tax=Umbra pygmaea TaxID=75934 RepID=A0ABD0VW64_UMBPY